jgi:hypothetical protein
LDGCRLVLATDLGRKSEGSVSISARAVEKAACPVCGANPVHRPSATHTMARSCRWRGYVLTSGLIGVGLLGQPAGSVAVGTGAKVATHPLSVPLDLGDAKNEPLGHEVVRGRICLPGGEQRLGALRPDTGAREAAQGRCSTGEVDAFGVGSATMARLEQFDKVGRVAR